LLCNHHLTWHVDLKIVGAISLALTLELEGPTISYRDISEHFDAPAESNTKACYNKSREILTFILARDKVEAGIRKLPRKYRQHKFFKAAKVSEVTRRLRKSALDYMSMSSLQKRAMFSYIIAACIQQAMWQFKLRITMQDVYVAMDLNYDELLDPAIATSVIEGLGKGKYVEDHVRRFAASKDWKVPVGTKEGEIEKIRAARTKAD
jgi:hypothetical protein